MAREIGYDRILSIAGTTAISVAAGNDAPEARDMKIISEVLACRWCDCSRDVYLCSLHSAHANLTIDMQLHTLH
jgi:hypothetical protein